jgi:carbon-monoxide dehydrogenase medium subunit
VRPFELAEPSTLREAVDLLDPDDPSVRPIAGGTALMLMMKAGVFRPTRLVSLRRVESRFYSIEAGLAGLRIGSMVTLAQLGRTPEVAQETPVITQTLRTLSNIRVRNVATVGGSLAHGDPHMDLPPVMMALAAQALVIGPAGNRLIPIEQLYAGYYETVLARNELIAEIIVPRQTGRRSTYLKCTTRAVHDWPALGVAVSLEADETTIRDATLVISAAIERPTRIASVEQALRGARVSDALLRYASESAADEVEVSTDARGTAAYKKQLVRVYVERALRKALSTPVPAEATQ